MAVSLAGLGLLLAGPPSFAQGPFLPILTSGTVAVDSAASKKAVLTDNGVPGKVQATCNFIEDDAGLQWAAPFPQRPPTAAPSALWIADPRSPVQKHHELEDLPRLPLANKDVRPAVKPVVATLPAVPPVSAAPEESFVIQRASAGLEVPVPGTHVPKPVAIMPRARVGSLVQTAPPTSPVTPPGPGRDRERPPEEQATEVPNMVQTEPPGLEVATRRDSERGVLERIRQQALQRTPPERVDFPDEPVLSKGQPVFRTFPPTTELVEPNYVEYRRLYFQDLNSERYGWDLGMIQPIVSAGEFFAGVALLPYKMGVDPCRKFDANTGYCLPGDPVPYEIYPPHLSVTGAILEVGTVVGLVAIFPG